MGSEHAEVLAIAQLRRDVASGRARVIREQAKLSQSEVAHALGVHWTTVAHWEAGRRVPRGASAARYADLLWQLDLMTREAS